MLNINNTVNYKINVKRKEKKYSWSTVFAWLYLKTIGRILPKKWNKWAENILYYDKATGSNEIRTDDPEITDESAQIEPEIAEKGSQSEVISKDETTFQDTTMQTEYIETTDKNIEADLESEVAEKGSQSEVISENGEVQEDEEYLENFTVLSESDSTVEKIAFYNSILLEVGKIGKEHEHLGADLKKLMDKFGAQGINSTHDQLISTIKDGYKGILNEQNLVAQESEVLKEKVQEFIDILTNSESVLGSTFSVLFQEKEEEISKLAGELKQAQEKNAELEGKVGNLDHEIGRQKSDIDRLNDQLAGMEELRIQLKSTQESKQQLEKEKIDLEDKLKDLNSQLRTAVKEREDSKNEVSKLQKQVQILEGSKEWELAGIDDSLKKVFLDVIGILEKELLINNQEQRLQGKKVDLEDKLKILISQLNATEEEKQILEGNKAEEIERLKAELKKESDEALQEKLAEQEKLIEQLKKEQKQVESQLEADIKRLQEEKRDQLTEIDSLKGNLSIVEEQLKQQLLLNNQEQQKLEEKLKDVDKRLEDTDEKTKKSQEQTKAHKPDAVSTVSTAKSTTESTLSKLRNLPNKLFGDKNLNNFLSRRNEELKKGFPEFKEKHFCHNMLNETIKSLSNQDDGKFESSKLLELLESNLKQSAREIIEAKVKEVVNKHCNIGENVGKELRDGTLKAKLSPSVRKCVKKLEFNKQEEGVNKIVDSILHSFNSKNNNNNDSGELLKEIVVKELVEARMRFFSDKIQELQLTPSIRDKFLSPDQKMCSRIPGKENMYKLSTEVINKIRGPNSSMSSPNIASIHSLSSRKAVRVGS
ncbi:coiled-coil domain-containing protein [Wolbachia endosymbiont (group A) of Bibio marci]|uniref:hypothetical protein n=1 Tax=Wolbachia endosymbiont (group A) of Bibio marci TaxID=2953987 RepID=UPI002230AF79|nr:hypothetical protein [Wolbachia endosymbiont (group A) of Bibio marci]